MAANWGNQANRGKAFEDLITLTNIQYRRQHRLVEHKVPTEWIPLRAPGGHINGAKCDNKAAVDYLGAYRGRPLAFDAKHVADPTERAIRWDRVEPHQEEFMQDWQKIGQGITFILAGFQLVRFYIIPWDFWQQGLEKMRAGGPKSINLKLFPKEWEVDLGHGVALDYLATVDRLFFREVIAQ